MCIPWRSIWNILIAICNAEPSTDADSVTQGQNDVYFALPYDRINVYLPAYNNRETATVLLEDCVPSLSRRNGSTIMPKPSVTPQQYWTRRGCRSRQ
jgi:hypothetical protein